MENRKTGLTIRHRRMSVVRIQRVYFGENIRSFSSGQMKLSVRSTVSTVNPPLSSPRGLFISNTFGGVGFIERWASIWRINNRMVSVLHLRNRFHVAVRQFSNRSQMTSKCGKNKEVAQEPQASVSLIF